MAVALPIAILTQKKMVGMRKRKGNVELLGPGEPLSQSWQPQVMTC